MSTETTPLLDLDEADHHDLQIAILVCPGYAPIDVIGIHTVFGMLPGTRVHLVGKDLDEIVGIPTFPTRATTTFAACPADLDVLFAGAVPAHTLEDEETLALLADRGARARWVAGACVGTLLLGAAGLLRGYRATTNFHVHDLLPSFGAIPTRGNVVEDRNRITAGPATGGIEIALRLVQDFYGDEVAREVELQTEYAPTPRFGVGTPELAGPELTRRALDHAAALGVPLRAVAERAAERLGVTAAAAG